MQDLINGLKYIHSKGILHKDLRPANIFVSKKNELVIGNFQINSTYYKYIAPELKIDDTLYTTDSDIYNLGCTIYKIYTFYDAYDDLNRNNKKLQFKRVNGGYKIPRIEYLINRMLENDPLKRIKIDEIESEVIQMKELAISNIYTSGSSYRNITVEFYLDNGNINGKNFKEICEMSKDQFKAFWNENKCLSVCIY